MSHCEAGPFRGEMTSEILQNQPRQKKLALLFHAVPCCFMLFHVVTYLGVRHRAGCIVDCGLRAADFHSCCLKLTCSDNSEFFTRGLCQASSHGINAWWARSRFPSLSGTGSSDYASSSETWMQDGVWYMHALLHTCIEDVYYSKEV